MGLSSWSFKGSTTSQRSVLPELRTAPATSWRPTLPKPPIHPPLIQSQHQHHLLQPIMAYFSNILTATKTRYQTLRNNTEEIDGDAENDSHISRVLRSYYSETQRPYPDWLGPPPSVRSQSPSLSLRSNSNLRRNNSNQPASLSDIWDAAPQQQQQQQQAPPQRHQSPSLFPDEGPSNSPAPAMTAQQRIRERLWGNKRSDASSPPQQGYTPPPQQQNGRMEMPGMGRDTGRRAPPPQQQQQQQYQQPAREDKPYLGAGMPWDDGGYSAPAPVREYSAPANLRRGGRPGLPTGPKPNTYR